MTIRAWRITKAKHASAAFSGDGAKAYGGRWNSPGTSVVYTAGSVSLAVLEILVHLQIQDVIQRYVLFEVTFDEGLVKTIPATSLPKTWRRSPPPTAVQRVGDDWVAAADSAVLQVPSAIIPNEWIYLLNPAHADFSRITIGPKQQIRLDPRLIKPATS